MKLVIKVVQEARVSFETVTEKITKGAIVYIGFEAGDTPSTVEKAAEFLIKRRFFPDKTGKIRLSATEYNPAFLLIPNFTLTAQFTKGQQRISFDNTLKKEKAELLFKLLTEQLKKRGMTVRTGGFGKMMYIIEKLSGPYTYVTDIT